MAHEVTTTDGEMDQSGSQGAAALSTVHLYYEDTELFSNTAKVIAVREADPEVEGERIVALVTDETVMHPQGGKEKMVMGSHQICFCFQVILASAQVLHFSGIVQCSLDRHPLKMSWCICYPMQSRKSSA